MDSNISKSSQSNVLFSNPTNQMSSTKQWNFNLFVVMLMWLWCYFWINCQAQTVSSFLCLRVQEKLCSALSTRMGSLVGLENTCLFFWKEKLQKSVTCKYSTRVCGVGFEYCRGCSIETLQRSLSCFACVGSKCMNWKGINFELTSNKLQAGGLKS